MTAMRRKAVDALEDRNLAEAFARSPCLLKGGTFARGDGEQGVFKDEHRCRLLLHDAVYTTHENRRLAALEGFTGLHLDGEHKHPLVLRLRRLRLEIDSGVLALKRVICDRADEVCVFNAGEDRLDILRDRGVGLGRRVFVQFEERYRLLGLRGELHAEVLEELRRCREKRLGRECCKDVCHVHLK